MLNTESSFLTWGNRGHWITIKSLREAMSYLLINLGYVAVLTMKICLVAELMYLSQKQLCYLGCRNGSVQGFDRRTSSGAGSKTIELLDGRYVGSGHSIAHVSVLRDWQLLISTIGGKVGANYIRSHITTFNSCLTTRSLKHTTSGSPATKTLWCVLRVIPISSQRDWWVKIRPHV